MPQYHRWFHLASVLLLRLAWSASPGVTAGTVAFRADPSLVLVNVGVTDHGNRLVGGLDREDFQVFDNGTRQHLAYFTSEDSPLSLGMLLDTSNSMADKLALSRQSAAQFLRHANPTDEVFLETFNDRPKVALDFTNQFQEVQNLAALQVAGGKTGLLDAIGLALQHMQKAANRRRALLLITDAADNASRFTPREIVALSRESDVAIYAIGIFDSHTENSEDPLEIAARNLLQELTSVTGGRLYPVRSAGEIADCAEEIAVELHNQYLLGYYPTSVPRDGKYHRLNVKVNRPGGSRLWPAARPGYYAPSR